MGTTGTLKLVNIDADEDATKLVYASYLKKDFIERSIVLYIGADRRVKEMHFSSNSYGTAEWRNGHGIVDCHRWESEEHVQATSYLNRHYTAILQNGIMGNDYAEKRIIPDVLSAVAIPDLAQIVKTAVAENRYDGVVDLAAIGLD